MLYSFDPKDISRRDMASIAVNIESYIELLEEIMIFPKDLEGDREEFNDALKTAKSLIKKLSEGDRSVFKELEED